MNFMSEAKLGLMSETELRSDLASWEEELRELRHECAPAKEIRDVELAINRIEIVLRRKK